MQIITLINEKGGVGKTTTAVTLAAGFASKGKRVVLIDADPQGNATIALGQTKGPGVYDLLVREAEWQSVLRPIPEGAYRSPFAAPSEGKLFLLPSNIETRNIASSISDAFIITDRLAQLEGQVDIVVIDTSPTPSLLHGIVYLATDSLLYTTTCESMAFDGLIESIKHRQEAVKKRAQSGIAPIRIMGILPTMYRAQTLEHQDNLHDLKAEFGDLVWQPVAQRTVWTEASRKRKTIFAYAPGSTAEGDAQALVARAWMEIEKNG